MLPPSSSLTQLFDIFGVGLSYTDGVAVVFQTAEARPAPFPIFYDDKYPFDDPSDDEDTESDEDEEAYSTPPTQAREPSKPHPPPVPAAAPSSASGEFTRKRSGEHSSVEQPSQALHPPP
eukprot:CAMPEP_0181345294 /NCGR_PEP_ID=MMETSP1101-20121128/32671_1 /TAXON_ID=46948 /ORGANISM="Rhodomonas abbreviata, Strain Caron Lab Isolate" /LENGTH=119 /DNA_ID=CAMNT_0023457237 /DNA_START=667 /DNA_END=1024 /DNA_ORIENTATION=-